MTEPEAMPNLTAEERESEWGFMYDTDTDKSEATVRKLWELLRYKRGRPEAFIAAKAILHDYCSSLLLTISRERELREKAEAALAGKWIAVSERLPDELDEVLFLAMEPGTCDDTQLFSVIHKGSTYSANGIFYAVADDLDDEFSIPISRLGEQLEYYVTHWQPLPLPPKGNERG